MNDEAEEKMRATLANEIMRLGEKVKERDRIIQARDMRIANLEDEIDFLRNANLRLQARVARVNVEGVVS